MFFTWEGWGRTEESINRGSDVKRFVALPGVSNEECSSAYQRSAQISDLQLCAGKQIF